MKRGDASDNYVKSQSGLAWKAGLEVMEDLKAPFQLAATIARAMPNAFPALARLLSAQQAVAQRGAATRKRNAAAAAATPATTATSTSGTAATGTTAAASTVTAALPAATVPALPAAAPVVNVTS